MRESGIPEFPAAGKRLLAIFARCVDMTTAIDTNIFVALWDKDEPLNPAVRPALDLALARGSLVIAGPVYSELLAYPSRSEAFLDQFLGDTAIFVDWNLDKAVWRTAGHAYQALPRVATAKASRSRACGGFLQIS